MLELVDSSCVNMAQKIPAPTWLRDGYRFKKRKMSFQDDTTTTNAGQAAMICELQQDLLMAAQVGQQLLEENVRLKEDLAAVNKRYVDVKNEHSLERERTDDYRALMEGRVKQLEEELMQRTKDQLSLEDHGIAAEQSRRESVKRAEARVFELQSELAQGQEARTRLIGELRESKVYGGWGRASSFLINK